MLGNFSYLNATKLYFGDDSLKYLNEELPKYGQNIQIIYGGGCFGQSLTAIVKPAPGASHGEGLAVNYSEGAKMSEDVSDWLEENGMNGKQKKAFL